MCCQSDRDYHRKSGCHDNNLFNLSDKPGKDWHSKIRMEIKCTMVGNILKNSLVLTEEIVKLRKKCFENFIFFYNWSFHIWHLIYSACQKIGMSCWVNLWTFSSLVYNIQRRNTILLWYGQFLLKSDCDVAAMLLKICLEDIFVRVISNVQELSFNSVDRDSNYSTSVDWFEGQLVEDEEQVFQLDVCASSFHALYIVPRCICTVPWLEMVRALDNLTLVENLFTAVSTWREKMSGLAVKYDWWVFPSWVCLGFYVPVEHRSSESSLMQIRVNM